MMLQDYWTAYVIVGFLGLIFGSFATVLTLRIPKGISILTPRSRCENCGKQIPAAGLTPVFSYLMKKGRTSCCNTKLSSIYPLVELGTSVLFLLSLKISGSYPELIGLLILSVLTLPLIVIDITEHRLPNLLTFFGLISGILVATASSIINNNFGILFQAVALSLLSGFIFYTLNILTRGGMGMGDVKLAAMLGALMAPFGPANLFAGFVFAFLIGSIISIALLISRRASRKSMIPFGPAMLFGSWLALCLGNATTQNVLIWHSLL